MYTACDCITSSPPPKCCKDTHLTFFFSASGFSGSYVTYQVGPNPNNIWSLAFLCGACSPTKTAWECANVSFSWVNGVDCPVAELLRGAGCNDGVKTSVTWRVQLVQSADKKKVKWVATYTIDMVPIVCGPDNFFPICWFASYIWESATFDAPMDCSQTITDWNFIGVFGTTNGNVLETSGASLVLHT